MKLSSFSLGIGTMAWSRSRMLGYGHKLGLDEIRPIFTAALASGIRFFDTAEAYAQSEKLLGKLLRETDQVPFIATKYAPWPWRFSRRALIGALDRSLSRLGLDRVDLYQIHMPVGFVSQAKLWESLAEVVESGRARYVGVSNYPADLMRRAHAALAKRSIALVSNQVEYSLVKRAPEVNGQLEACRELGIHLIAYSPLGRGVLSGRYSPGRSPADSRRFFNQFKNEELERVLPLIQSLKAIGEKVQKSPAQVALNWLSRQPMVIPIPGANQVEHVRSSAGSVNWSMTEEEANQIDRAAAWFKKPAASMYGLR
jgi:aryl-alcohol dehydrogenase-like predicted oxidoreductase